MCLNSKLPEEHIDHLRQVLTCLRKNALFVKTVKCFWAKRESKYLDYIVGNGIVRTSPCKVAIVKDWPLSETQKHIKSFMAFCSFYRMFIHHFADCSAPLPDSCRMSLAGRVIHSNTTMVAFDTPKVENDLYPYGLCS